MTTIFIKLGGSLITDKQVEASFRTDVMQRLSMEIAAAYAQQPDLKLIVGHGSGSFGHFAAKRHGTMQGVHTAEQWRGFTEVADAAAQLNHHVFRSLRDTQLPIWKLQPSASAHCTDGVITSMALEPLRTALTNRLIPLVYGDVALDTVRGGTIISTETIIQYITAHIQVDHVLLLGEVPGVLDQQGDVIPHITPQTLASYQDALGGSAGTDVTGGMFTKVRDMLTLASSAPGLQIRIMDGREPGLLQSTLVGDTAPGTLLTSN